MTATATARSSIELLSPRLRCAIDHERGASILGLWARRHAGSPWCPVIGRGIVGEDPRAKPPCFIMAPWTNRIANARFRFGGQLHQLRPTPDDGTARHGDVRSRPFDIVDRSPLSARLALESARHPGINFPFAFACEVRYELLDPPGGTPSLRVDLSVVSRDGRPFPAGCGLHPYYPRAPIAGHAGARPRVLIDADGRVPMIRNVPVGRPTADTLTRRFRSPAFLPAAAIDDLFTGFRGAAVVWPGLALGIDVSDNLAHMVMFAPKEPDGTDSPFLAVEPVSMANDGFNAPERGQSLADAGVAVLSPGQRLDTTTTFSVAFDEGHPRAPVSPPV